MAESDMTTPQTTCMFLTNNATKGMVLDSLGRLTLGGTTANGSTSTLYVSGSSQITGNELVHGTISTNQNIYLNAVGGKIGVLNGALGSAESSIQTAGLKATLPTTMGVHLGMDSLTTAAGMTLCAASSSQNAYIDFTYLNVTAKGKILNTNSGNNMTFATNSVERMRIDSGGALMIGSTSSDGVYKLKVIGPTFFSAAISGPTSIATSGAVNAATLTTTGAVTCGSLQSGLPKNFDIVHPTKDGYRLRHRCLEGPLAYLFYHYQFEGVEGLNAFPLPDYVDALNKDVLIYVSSFKHFGVGRGESVGNNTLNKCCNASGFYNIQVVGTRDDPLMENVYETEPVEYIPA